MNISTEADHVKTVRVTTLISLLETTLGLTFDTSVLRNLIFCRTLGEKELRGHTEDGSPTEKLKLPGSVKLEN